MRAHQAFNSAAVQLLKKKCIFAHPAGPVELLGRKGNCSPIPTSCQIWADLEENILNLLLIAPQILKPSAISAL